MARKSTWALCAVVVVVCGGIVVFAAENETSAVNEVEEEETFEQLEKKVKTNVGNMVKQILPFLMRGSSDAKVSGPCLASIMKIIGGVRQLREWAIRFVDATGKIPPGILEGTSFSIGDYDECLDIKVGKKDELPQTPEETIFTGQYCLLELKRPQAINRAIADFEKGNRDSPIAKTKTFLNMFVRYKHLTNSTMKFGICVPSKCTKEDIRSVMNSEAIRNQVGNVNVPYCEAKRETHSSTEQIILLCLFGFIVFCVIAGTLADAFLRLLNDEKDLKSVKMNYVRFIIQKTSLYSNAISVLSTKKNPNCLQSLCGLRTIIVTIIIYSHSYAYLHKLHFQKFSKAANFLRFFDNFFFSGVGNGSVTLDSIIFVSAVTITYSRWRFVSKGSQVNLSVVKLLLQRYFRMSAAQLLTIGIFLLFPLVGTGPLWGMYMASELKNCQKRWWLNILYISNFWEHYDLCLYHTWILSLLMQLTLIGVIIIWILKRFRRIGIFFMVILTLCGIITVTVLTVIHELPGSLAFYMLDARSFPIAWRDIFTKPIDHIGPFCIGLLAGYFMALRKDRLEISKITSICLWCSSIACCTAVMFGLYSYRHGEKLETPLAAFYALMHRNAWCLGIGWLVVACTTHHGGPVSRVLKSKIFVPLDRLCYMAYLIHLPIMHYRSASIRERWYMGHSEILFMAISYIVASYLASFFLHIIFVEPYYAIEKHVSSFFRPKDKVILHSKTDMNEVSIPKSIVEPEVSVISNGCINLGYSKKLDGI